MECVNCECVWLGAVWEVRRVSGYEDWVWDLPIMWEQGGVGRVSVFGLRWCRWREGLGQGLEEWCYVCVILEILCVDCRSRYLYIVLDGYMRISGASSVQSCCTLSISAF